MQFSYVHQNHKNNPFTINSLRTKLQQRLADPRSAINLTCSVRSVFGNTTVTSLIWVAREISPFSSSWVKDWNGIFGIDKSPH